MSPRKFGRWAKRCPPDNHEATFNELLPPSRLLHMIGCHNTKHKLAAAKVQIY